MDISIWRTALEIIQKELPKDTFDLWFKPTKAVSATDDILTIGVPNNFFKDWLIKYHKTRIEEVLWGINKNPVQINLCALSDSSPPKEAKIFEKKAIFETFNPKYIFDSFVVGDSNRFTYAGCMAVAEKPGQIYNPLFIYGGVGLGKTHLLHAIAQFVRIHQPKLKIVYTSSEQFVNEFVDSIRYGTTPNFKSKYRKIDLLLVDDIHFLAGKSTSQEEFFHTFNTLYDSSKQIVLSSDRPPREIPTIEERLRSRFECGLLTDIQPPNLETRVAILRKKAEEESMVVPEDVIFFIANKIKNNIRELEGGLIRLVAFSSFTGERLTVELSKKILKDVFGEEENPFVTMEDIQKKVVRYFKIQPNDIRSKKRNASIVLARQVAMYLIRELTSHSLPEIGKFFDKDHTTVLYSHVKLNAKLSEDADLRNIIDTLSNEIIKSTIGGQESVVRGGK